MNAREAEQFLLSIVNLPRQEYMKDPNHCKVYLDRLQWFLDILGNPEKKIPHYVHVAGTSGKGSVCNFVNQILVAGGYKTGMLQSPHPSNTLQRWQIGNRLMTKDELTEIVKTIKHAMDTYIETSPYDMISYSELKTAIGLLYFAKKKIDWCVLETACGGRYDSTNIVPNKDISVVTNIGLDHVAILGNSKKKIAYEKAGIIKKGSVAFTTEKSKPIRDIIEKEATLVGAPLTVVEPTYQLLTETIEGLSFSYKGETYTLQTRGHHQITNAILAIEIATHIGIPISAIKKGLQKEKQTYRMELVGKKPYVIIDTAHNDDKMKSSVDTLSLLLRQHKEIKNIHLVVGFSGDKKLDVMATALAQLPLVSVACSRNTMNPFRRVHSPKDIQEAFTKVSSAKTKTFIDPKDALVWSKKQAKKSDLILITGSVFIAGELSPLAQK